MKISLNRRVFGAALVLCTCFAGMNSCTKIDTLPMLEIKVVDIDSQIVPGILIGLFDSQEEWSMHENPLQAWRETNIYGEALFIHLKEQIYYIYVDGDSISNIGHEIKLLEPLKMNEKSQITITVE